MQKKFQVFVSSTYKDLLEERQAAVEAILKAGHVPAGMELFAAGDRSQWDTIQQWIEESDIFMLILGARYGSIESTSAKSYVQLEYEFALSKGKPLFAVVMGDKWRDRRVKDQGEKVLERESVKAYDDFKRLVLSKMSSFADDAKDIKLAVHETIPTLTHGRNLAGWIRGDQVPDAVALTEELKALRRKNQELQKAGIPEEAPMYQKIFEAMKKESISVPSEVIWNEFDQDIPYSRFDVLRIFEDKLVLGLGPTYAVEKWLLERFAPRLSVLGLVEFSFEDGVRTCSLTDQGRAFLRWAHLEGHFVEEDPPN